MSIQLKVPSVGESVTEVEIGEWLKKEGDTVGKDENVVVIETEKATIELPAPESGRITKILKKTGSAAKVGDVIGEMEIGTVEKKEPEPEKKKPEKPTKAEKKESRQEPSDEEPSREKKAPPKQVEVQARVMPAAQRVMAEAGLKAEDVEATGPGGRTLKEDAERAVHAKAGQKKETSGAPSGDTVEEVVPMTPLRRKIAERLVAAQRTAALLTTFNEIDMTAVQKMRHRYQDRFQRKYAIKLGLMSFFAKASIEALKEFPALNAEVRDTDIVYHNYYDIGIAMGAGKGLVVPVLRRAERLSFAEIEKAIAEFAERAQENKLRPDDLHGGTFTITNGGVFGSLLSTPIVNPPQSGILGLHAIQDRPVALDGQVVVRPMMYVALTYDHRIVDGREAVTFLRRIKEVIESPSRMLLEI
jgi:2-oxoglutarate dehydrogenase E2 component (dihydrolipoamide succinyltransferase)